MSESITTRSRPGCLKLILFTLFTLLTVFALVEGVWRLVCLAGLKIPPSGDRNLDKEWEWVVITHDKGKHPITEGPSRDAPGLGWGL